MYRTSSQNQRCAPSSPNQRCSIASRSDGEVSGGERGADLAEAAVMPGDALGLPRNQIRVHDYHGASVLVSTTGYTGEVGFELYVPPELAAAVWRDLADAGKPVGLAPVGLGGSLGASLSFSRLSSAMASCRRFSELFLR